MRRNGFCRARFPRRCIASYSPSSKRRFPLFLRESMTPREMHFRHGFYCGLADRLLGGSEYAARRPSTPEALTLDRYLADVTEIQAKLVAAGHYVADEDPIEREYPGFSEKLRRC